MTDAEIIEALGGASAVADLIGAGQPQVVSNWKNPARGIPARWRPRIVALARLRGLALDEDRFLGVEGGIRRPDGAADPSAVAA